MLRDLFSLFPAHAGVILNVSFFPDFFFAFPRTCGGDPLTDPVTELKDDFSPHMRG